MHRPENQQCGVLKYARYILKKYWELVIYGVVGVCTTVVNVVVFRILSENGLDLEEQYALDVFDEAFDRRASDLNGIVNLKLTSVADFFGIKGHGHNSLEDARMTAQIYEKFLELDENAKLLEQQEEVSNNPFAALGLGGLFD